MIRLKTFEKRATGFYGLRMLSIKVLKSGEKILSYEK